MDTRVLSAHVSIAMAQQVDDLAARLERPKGWVIKEALASYLALDEKRRRLTLEALQSVQAGRLVSHADLGTWVSSLGKPE